jgi:hypothetical protein
MSASALNPSNIFVPQPLAIANANFDQATGSLPPAGWEIGGPALGSSCTLAYDTSSQYEGAASLQITATAQYSGVTNTTPYQVRFGQVFVISGAVWSQSGDPAWIQINFFDINGNIIEDYLPGNGVSYRPGVSTTQNSWQYLTAQGTVPFGAVTAYVQCYMAGASGGQGEFGAISAEFYNAIPYYLSLIPSQYQAAPKFMQWMAVLLQPFVDIAICASGLNAAFNINTAIGNQLNVLGQFIGASRTLPFTPGNSIATAVIDAPGSSYVTGDVLTIVQAGASGGEVIYNATGPSIAISNVGAGYTNATGLATTGGHGTGLTVTITTVPWFAVLDDTHYRILLRAKILQNHWNGQVDSLWFPLQALFPGGKIYITDNQNMTATVLLVGAFDGLVQQMITQGLIAPRPEAVEYIYEFPTLPAFGFGSLNPLFIAGFGVGYWA